MPHNPRRVNAAVRSNAGQVPETSDKQLSPETAVSGNLPLSRENVDRWAPMIANGDLGFPPGLNPDFAEFLAEHVRQLRRKRLVQFIARVIAQDIRDSHFRET